MINYLKRALPKPVHDIVHAYRNWRSNTLMYKRIASLLISESGLLRNGTPFIKLRDGLTFYGHLPEQWQRYVYRYFASKNVQSAVPEDAFNVAADIIWRYEGPESSHQCFEEGKYYHMGASLLSRQLRII